MPRIHYQAAHFLLGVSRYSQVPPEQGCEVAFIGRSNSGKSSAINAVTGRRALARTSKTPGRTQQINFFALSDQQRLVDLPGYGYARVPDAVKSHWRQLIGQYLRCRQCLRGLVVVCDSRRGLTEDDLVILDWCGQAGLSAHLLLSKADKLNRREADKALREVREALTTRYGGDGRTCPEAQLFSATKGQGLQAAQARIEAWLDCGAAE